MRDAGYAYFGGEWIKACLRMVDVPSAFGQKLREICDFLGVELAVVREMADILSDTAIMANPRFASELEHMLRPAKILKCGIPNYIVPIRPNWAVDLFDSGLAEDMLWAGDSASAMNRVWFIIAGSPHIFKGFGRRLWYVSEHKRITGSKRIRACSRLTEIRRRPPGRFIASSGGSGSHSWEDVLARSMAITIGALWPSVSTTRNRFHAAINVGRVPAHLGSPRDQVKPSVASRN